MLLPTLAFLAVTAVSSPAPQILSVEVDPVAITLRGSDAMAQLVVTGLATGNRDLDLTEDAKYESQDEKIVAVTSDGLLKAAGDGETQITVRAVGKTVTVRVTVMDFTNTRPVHFATEVVPIFSKLGCNAGACHGKASGQNGFRLSLLGFDARFDHDALVREARGRRVFPAAPERSLMLLKPTAQIPHGGGRRTQVGSPEYNTLLRWIQQGMPFASGQEPTLVKLEVSPARRLIARQGRQHLRVTAYYDDGTTADVTRLAQYQSNAIELASVTDRGEVQVQDSVGEAAIMARFGGLVGVARATVPLGIDVPAWEDPPARNLIDPLVFKKLRELGLPPSEACTDAEFARRSSFDLCGVFPQPAEVIAFESDNDPNKRVKWVDNLLERPEYADLFAMKWSAILRNKRTPFSGGNADSVTFGFHAWIRQSLAENKPYDKFVAEIVAARGDAGSNPPVAWYRQNAFNPQNQEEEKVEDTAQLFLGMRIQCARCHHHPFEKWSQDDYYGFASFFSRVGRKAGSDQFTSRIYTLASGSAQNPNSTKKYAPKALDGPVLEKLGPYQDPRAALADWMRQRENPFFGKALVNRYWKHFFGRGLVEPEDDMRVSNPPTNPELLDALAADFVANGYDLKRLVRMIATSRAYDRSSLPNEYNATDRQNFARYYPRRLPAEVLLDAIDTVTGATERFNGLPKGFRAAQLPDEGFPSYFLEVFGRPLRESVCECERSAEANLTQSLHLLNSDEIQQKLTGKEARISQWAADQQPEAEKVDELYRLCFSRSPSDEERDICLGHLARRKAEGQPRQGYEDLVWTLINTKEFLLNH
ncbi:MAG TPA: DUF1553 domain-containing protein [Isosphaeraceae bacterium]|nr:DUF1553 domain-containing protein [Isosphaeraceae bacterium]